MRIGRRYPAPINFAFNVRRFLQNPGRWLWRRALAIPAISIGILRIGLGRIRISFLGFSIGISGRGISIRIPVISLLLAIFGLFRFGGGNGKGKGKGDGKGKGKGKGKGDGGGSENGGGDSKGSGDGPRGPSSEQSPTSSGGQRGPNGERGERGAPGERLERAYQALDDVRERLENERAQRRERERLERGPTDSARIERTKTRIRRTQSQNKLSRGAISERVKKIRDDDQRDRKRLVRDREARDERGARRWGRKKREREKEAQRVERERVEREEQTKIVERERVEREKQAQRVERERVEREEQTKIAEREHVEREKQAQRVECARVEREEQAQRVERARVDGAQKDAQARRQRRERRKKRWEERLNQESVASDEPFTPGGVEFDIAGKLPMGRVLLEASAGTGKTFNLTSLVVRYIVEDLVPIDSFLIVTFTRSAASELRKKTRDKLLEALEFLESGKEPRDQDRWLVPIASVSSDEERQDRIELIRGAVSGLDRAMITTIHGFCQRTLVEIGLRNGGLSLEKVGDGSSSGSIGVVRDVLLSELAKSLDCFGPDVAVSPMKIDEQIRQVINDLVANGATPHPEAGSGVGVAENWVTAVKQILAQQEAARRTSGETSFDDLIQVLEAILTDESIGKDVKTQLSARYKVIMIDEFQDTDSKQWSIFNSLFQDTSGGSLKRPDMSAQRALIMVGDPKQAIYRFRGADINAYLRATAADDTLSRYKLSTNHRSDRRLIHATNVLLKDRQFGHERIAYVQVTSPDQAPDGALLGGGAPLQIRWLPSHDKLLAGAKKLTVDIARPHIAEDLANHVIQLLNHGEIVEKKSRRKVRESDFTVLVRAKDDAIPIVEALQRHGVPVIQSRLDSVLNTGAADQLALLFTALDNYADARTVRALAFGWFVNLPYSALLDEQQVERLQERCAKWAEGLRENGVFGFYQKFRLDSEVVESIASHAAYRGVESLERLLTDLEHVVELLHNRTERLNLDARGYLIELALLKTQSGEPEAQERRTESDLNAVNVTTIHSSKGLEYPIVLIPYPKAVRNSTPFVYSIGSDRFVDAAPLVEWTAHGVTQDDRKEQARIEAVGDDMRLAYVALTRAKYQTVVWWANTQGMGASPLGRILFDATGRSTDGVKVPKDLEVRALLNELGSRAPDNLAISELPFAITVAQKLEAKPIIQPEICVADLKRLELGRSDYWRWSYSAVKNKISDQGSDRKNGGSDEPWRSPNDLDSDFIAPLQSQPSGAKYGKWVHKLMEHLNFAHENLEAHIGEIFDSEPLFEGTDRKSHVDGLLAAIETPLEQIQSGFSLRKLTMDNRLDETEFLFPFGGDTAASQLMDLATVMCQNKEHPFVGYFKKLKEQEIAQSFRGLLTGSLDGLYRIRSGDNQKFIVVDFKTNKLRDYTNASMKVEMEHHDYPLQALFYSVGLHRFLKMRLPDYAPSSHLGGSAYLFLRGMNGVETPLVDGKRNGAFIWAYPPELIEMISRWFAGEQIS